MFRKFTVLMSAATLAIAAGLANAATLQDVEFSSLSGDRTEVVLGFDGTPPEPSGYTIERPARIAIDLKDTVSGLDSRNMSLGDGNTTSMTVVETQDRTRLIFNLVELTPYETEIVGNNLIVIIGDGGDSGGGTTASSKNSSESMSTPAPVTGDAITGVDFRRGADGEGRVIIDLSGSGVPVALNEQGGRIRLVMDGTEVPSNLRRRLDVTDFATPVTRVDTFREGADAIVEIRPQGAYDYLAYQSGSRFTVSVEKLTEEEAERRQEEKFPYTGDKLSLNFQDIEVRSVLQLIADFTGLNLVASDTVDGSITLRLQNVPWDQALDLILKTKGLDKRQIGNVLLVAPAEEIAARERMELETSKQIAELAPVRLEIIQVNYAKAGDIVGLIQQDEELISDRGFISSDVRTNTISVRETAEKLEEIRRLINTWDIPVRQVSIEARIVRAQTNVAESLGIRWGGGIIDNDGSNTLFGSGSLEGGDDLYNNNEVVYPESLVVDLGVAEVGASSFNIGWGGADFLVNLELSALESDGKAEIVSQPRVVTADRQTAKIESGQEIPYQEASSSGATSTSFKEAALSLEVTPQITPDNKIIMDLLVTQDSRGEDTDAGPAINTNSVTTQVLVGNGETVVLGGIFQSESTNTVTKTPVLGDIPFVGVLFRRTESSNLRSELLIFITPKIMQENLID